MEQSLPLQGGAEWDYPVGQHKDCTGTHSKKMGSDKDELHPVPASVFRQILNSTKNTEDKFRCLVK